MDGGGIAPNRLLRHAFFLLIVRPLVLLVLGLNVRHRERLPTSGPAILVANHNSHLDTMVLITLFPRRMLNRLRPVAAADYFFKNRLLKWFATRIIGILPVERGAGRDRDHDPLAGIIDSLDRGEIPILFPEGTRGEPETLDRFKSGIARVVERRPDVPVVPVFLHGLGKALPRGEAVLVPFFCDVFVGEPVPWEGDRRRFVATLREGMDALAAEGDFPDWE